MILAAFGLAAALAAAPSGPPPSDGLTAAKELYATAAYEDALAMLSRLSASPEPDDRALQVEEYRWLCLYALGRTDEAQAAARELVRTQPLARLDQEDLSPRAQAMFAEVRRELLPAIAKERYKAAKSEVEQKQFGAARQALAEVKQIVDEAAAAGVTDESLGDLRVLADGFLDLATAGEAAAATAAAKPAAERAVASAPAAPPAATRPDPGKLYDASDAGVIAPVTIRQVLPPVPGAVLLALRGKEGILQLTIGTDGRVEEAVMRRPVIASYDATVVEAARQWRYKPAMKDGAPVKFVKAIVLAFHDEE